MEVNYRQKKLSDKDKIGIVNDYNTGMKIADIVARYGVSANTVYRTLRAMVKKAKEVEIQTEPTVS